MKKLRLLPLLVVVCAASVLAQSTDDLLNDGKNTDNVTTQSMGYARQNYSPLKQINASTVKRLVPVWTTSLMNVEARKSVSANWIPSSPSRSPSMAVWISTRGWWSGARLR